LTGGQQRFGLLVDPIRHIAEILRLHEKILQISAAVLNLFG